MKFDFNNKRVLILKIQGIGDTVLLVPMLQRLFKRYPEIKLDIAVLKNGSKELLEFLGLKFIKIIEVKNNYAGYISLILKIIFKYYAIILPYKSGKKENLIAFFSFCKRRIGYTYKILWKKYYFKLFDFLINYQVPVSQFEHYVLMNLKLIEETDLNLNDFFIKDIESKKIINYLKLNKIKKYIVIHLWAGDRERLWDIENYKKIVAKILNEFLDIYIFLVGKGFEEELNYEFKKNFKTRRILVFKNDFNLNDLLFLMKNSILVFGNDSGVMHLASIVGGKILTIFGYTNFLYTSPVGDNVYVIKKSLKCSPCYQVFLPVKCIYNEKKCLTDIKMEKVWQILKKLIENKNINHNLILSTGAKVVQF